MIEYTIEKILQSAAKELSCNHIENPRFESELLLSEVLKCNRAMLYAHKDHLVSAENENVFLDGIRRRADHEPMAYIIGHREFMGLDLKVTKDVLIPRPDTECVVEAAIEWLSQQEKNDLKVLDLCTGSGAIGLAIKKALPTLDITLTDLSEAALDLARENSERLGLAVRFSQGDLFEAVGDCQFHCIVSNPPYIPNKVITTLESEVKDHEPYMALSGGESGFDFYDAIISEASQHLYPGGLLLLEAGDGQGETLIRKMSDSGFDMCIRAYDLIGTLRGVGGNSLK